MACCVAFKYVCLQDIEGGGQKAHDYSSYMKRYTSDLETFESSCKRLPPTSFNRLGKGALSVFNHSVLWAHRKQFWVIVYKDRHIWFIYFVLLETITC
jgi:hypothetical protein